MVRASTRTSLPGASVASPLTVSIAKGPSPSKRPEMRRSPEVVVARRPVMEPARTTMSPDTVRAAMVAGPSAPISMSPDTASIVSDPLTSRRTRSPDADR
jgi:hypothetical protein